MIVTRSHQFPLHSFLSIVDKTGLQRGSRCAGVGIFDILPPAEIYLPGRSDKTGASLNRDVKSAPDPGFCDDALFECRYFLFADLVIVAAALKFFSFPNLRKVSSSFHNSLKCIPILRL